MPQPFASDGAGEGGGGGGKERGRCVVSTLGVSFIRCVCVCVYCLSLNDRLVVLQYDHKVCLNWT